MISLMKRTLMILLLLATIGSSYAQDKKKPVKATTPATAFDLLDTDQKVKVKALNQRFVADMKALLAQPIQDPKARRLQIEKLRGSRDSTMKVLLGEQTFTEFQRKAITKKS